MRRFYGMIPYLLATTAMPRRMAETAEEGAPAAPVEGVVQDGGTTRFTPPTQETGAEAPAPETTTPVKPEGMDQAEWDEFQAFKAAKAAPAAEEPKVTTEGKEGEEAKTGIDLLVAQSLEGVAPEMAPKVEPFVRAFAETGTLTDEQVTQAAKETGFSEAMVRQFMAGGEAQLAASVAPFHALTDGAEGYASFQAWANTALGPEDQGKINAAIDAGKPEDMAELVEAWKASGSAPAARDLTQGASMEGDSSSAADVFTSREQVTKVVNSRKYKTDPAYRTQMEAKIGRSNV